MKTVLIFASVLLASQSANGFGFGLLGGGGGGGGGCGGCPAPACPARPACSAPACSQPSAPACPVCPPPPPPCPAAPIASCGGGGGCGGGGCGGGYGGGGGGGYRGQSSNDCCSSCGQSCRFRRFRLSGAPTSIRGTNPMCNSEKVRQVMRDNMSGNANLSKRSILKAMQQRFVGNFSVICSNGDLSYIVNSDLFCLEMVAGSTCYVFRN